MRNRLHALIDGKRERLEHGYRGPAARPKAPWATRAPGRRRREDPAPPVFARQGDLGGTRIWTSWRNVSKPNMPWTSCPCFASGTHVRTSARREVEGEYDMEQIRVGLESDAGGFCLEEIEQRLESARLSGGDASPWETCLWACECFSVFERTQLQQW